MKERSGCEFGLGLVSGRREGRSWGGERGGGWKEEGPPVKSSNYILNPLLLWILFGVTASLVTPQSIFFYKKKILSRNKQSGSKAKRLS